MSALKLRSSKLSLSRRVQRFIDTEACNASSFVSVLRQSRFLRKLWLSGLRLAVRIFERAWADGAAVWRGRGNRLRQPGAIHLQLGDKRRPDIVQVLPARQRHSQSVVSRQSREVAEHRAGQAARALRHDPAGAADRTAQQRRTQRRDLPVSVRRSGDIAHHDGTRFRDDHSGYCGSRRRRARAAPRADGRALSHAGGPLPSRTRTLLLRAAGAEFERSAGLPLSVRRRARRL